MATIINDKIHQNNFFLDRAALPDWLPVAKNSLKPAENSTTMKKPGQVAAGQTRQVS